MKYITELHAHSAECSECAEMTADRVALKYIRLGYDTLVLTNHFKQYEVERCGSFEKSVNTLFEAARIAAEFAGEETFIPIRKDFTTLHISELEKRRAAGDQNIHFLDGSTLFGADPSECTVDGVHATDLGFYQIARHTAPVIARILAKSR